MNLPNCAFCGRFVGWTKDYVTWIDFGSCLDLEPPDDSFAHLSCYENAHPTLKMLIDKYTWCPPQIVKGCFYGTSKQESSEDSSNQA